MLSRNLKFQRIKKGKKRLSVYKSNQHIYAQIIDESEAKVLCSASTLSEKKSLNCGNSKLVGELIGKKALDLNITDVFFDRNGNKYHGNVQALADGARSTGLKF